MLRPDLEQISELRVGARTRTTEHTWPEQVRTWTKNRRSKVKFGACSEVRPRSTDSDYGAYLAGAFSDLNLKEPEQSMGRSMLRSPTSEHGLGLRSILGRSIHELGLKQGGAKSKSEHSPKSDLGAWNRTTGQHKTDFLKSDYSPKVGL